MVSRLDIIRTRKYRTRLGSMGEISKMTSRKIAKKVVDWCCKYYDLDVKVKVKVGNFADFNCWGTCYQGNKKHHYNIEVAKDQTIKDFVATVAHEMVHVKQWETGRWTGDGEAEAERLQYQLANKMWKHGVL